MMKSLQSESVTDVAEPTRSASTMFHSAASRAHCVPTARMLELKNKFKYRKRTRTSPTKMPQPIPPMNVEASGVFELLNAASLKSKPGFSS